MTLGCLMAAISATYAHFTSITRNPTTDDLCLGHNRQMSSVLYDYVAPNQFPLVPFIIIEIGFALVLTRFLLYVVICVHLYRHDLSMKLILSDNVILHRHRDNVISLTGQMLNFACDIFFLIVTVLQLDYKSETAKFVMPTLALATYGMYGLFQIILSKPLKIELIKCLDSLLLMPLFARWLSFFNIIGIFSSLSSKVHIIRSSYLYVAQNSAQPHLSTHQTTMGHQSTNKLPNTKCL